MDLLNDDRIQESLKQIKANLAKAKEQKKESYGFAIFDLSPESLKMLDEIRKFHQKQEYKFFYGSDEPQNSNKHALTKRPKNKNNPRSNKKKS